MISLLLLNNLEEGGREETLPPISRPFFFFFIFYFWNFFVLNDEESKPLPEDKKIIRDGQCKEKEHRFTYSLLCCLESYVLFFITPDIDRVKEVICLQWLKVQRT